MDRVTQWIKK